MIDPTPRYAPWRVAAWLVFVLVLAGAGYVGRLGSEPPEDLAYRYSFAIFNALLYVVLVGILLLIALGLPKREAFALRRPPSWPRAIGVVAVLLFAIYAGTWIYVQILSGFSDLDPNEEQGLVPSEWDSSRAGGFVAFFVVVTVFAPVAEELTYRGLGFSLLARLGPWSAILATALLFGAAHGLLVGLPVLVAFGILLAWLRARTDSVYPPIVLHGTYNAIALASVPLSDLAG